MAEENRLQLPDGYILPTREQRIIDQNEYIAALAAKGNTYYTWTPQEIEDAADWIICPHCKKPTPGRAERLVQTLTVLGREDEIKPVEVPVIKEPD